MPSKHLIAVVFTVAICFGALVFYVWQGWQAQTGENVDLSFKTIMIGNDGKYENHKYIVIENSEEWGGIWSSAMFMGPSPPEIDFSTHIVIAVFMGVQPPTGQILIERITNMENELIVNIEETYPGRGVGVLAVATYPHHIIKIERVGKLIVFEVQQFQYHWSDENWNYYDEPVYELVGEYRIEPSSGPPEAWI